MAKTSNVIRTWRVYPRVHYFRKRLLDLYSRFRNVTGAFPESFQLLRSLKEIENLQTTFSKNLEVDVIGSCNLAQEKYLVDTKPLFDKTFANENEAGVTICVCYVRSACYDGAFFKEMKEVMAYFSSFYKGRLGSMFLVIDIASETTFPQQQEIFNHVGEFLGHPDSSVWDIDERLCFGIEGSVLATKISLHMERMLVSGFHMIYHYLKLFGASLEKKPRNRTRDVNTLFRGKHLITQLHSVFIDFHSLVEDADIRARTFEGGAEAMEVELPISVEQASKLLDDIAKSIRVNVVSIFQEQYNLPPSIINLLLDAVDLETKLKDSFSGETKRAIAERALNVKRLRPTLSYYRNMLHDIRQDVAGVLEDTGKALLSGEKIVSVMDKMLFEIEGYLQQTITEDFKKTSRPPSVPLEMRKELLELECVYAVATVLNTFEIHLHSEKEKMDDDNKSHEENMFSDVEVEIEKIIKKHNFKDPYKVRVISKLPRAQVRMQHEHGNPIHSKWPDREGLRIGTLGGFVKGEDRDLYGLTCAHVVNGPPGHAVYVYEVNHQLRKFAVSTPDMTINFGELSSFTLIDFAAIKVEKEMERNCIRLFKDEDGIYRSSTIVDVAMFSDLVGKFVFKYGATSNLTRGMIVSTDFEVTNSVNNYIVMVDSLPNLDNQTPFSAPGDSGSIVCFQNVQSDDVMISAQHVHLMALSMVNAGDMRLFGDDSKKTLTFMLDKPMLLLSKHLNMEWTEPNL